MEENMGKINDNQYYNVLDISQYINIQRCNNIEDKSYEDIKQFISSANIDITENDVESYLLKRAKEDGIDMTPVGTRGTIKASELNDELIKKMSDDFGKQLRQGQYKYNGYDLTYFKTYLEIIKRKGIAFCTVVDSLIKGEENPLINDLDIEIIENKISGYDLKRLKIVILNIYKEIKRKIASSNSMENYEKGVIHLHSLYFDGFTERDLYPSEELIDYGYYPDFHGKDYIPTSIIPSLEQLATKKKEEDEATTYFVKLFMKL
jgi:hypothetical protein